MKFAMMVLGCKVNDYEATYVRTNLLKKYEEVSFKEKADIYIIFTCCVTNTAESKTRKYVRRARALNPDAFVVAVGCLAQVKKEADVFLECDLVIGSNQKDKIVEYIESGIRENMVTDLKDSPFENLFIDSYPSKSRAFLKVQDGCNQFCSYCIIPYSRGRERSGKLEMLIEQAKILAKERKELVITGIHTGRYNDGEHNLYDLLKELIKIEDLKTIRLSSIEINEISDEIIELMVNNEKIARHLHIPVQACSNEVLKDMHRPYTIDEFITRVNYIRSRLDGVSISTDLIVGFPKETDEIFMNSLDKLKEISFSFIHLFPYSRKSGTLADRMDGHIDPREQKRRVEMVNKIQRPLTLKFNKSFIGKTVKVLIEQTRNGFSYGYCREYLYLEVPGEFEIGSLICVQIKSVDDDKIVGEYVTE